MNECYVIRINRGRYYQRRGYSHRLVTLSQADRLTLADATDIARRVMGHVVTL